VSHDSRPGPRSCGDGPRSSKPRQKAVDSPYHHGSHRALLRPEPLDGAAVGSLDAIVVPTVRPAAQLRHAAELARSLGSWLVVFCSGSARAAEVAGAFESERGLSLLAVDVPKGHEHPLLRFATSAISNQQAVRRIDIGHKRNLGFLLARMAGWRRIMFLDDDLVVEDPTDIMRAAGLLDKYESVGLSIGGYPDNSVVCHAHRIGRGHQETFVGGGALAVDVARTRSFFPDIYNEDWFFLLDNVRLRPVAVTGLAKQADYDPFANPDRASYEEFGDVLAEGVFWLLDQHRRVKDADHRFWAWFLDQRRSFIADVERRIRARPLEPDLQRRILAALAAAQHRRQSISAEMCSEYLRAWRADRTRWRNVLVSLPEESDPIKATRRLGLSPVVPRARRPRLEPQPIALLAPAAAG
jgi:hypothetical protein